MLFYGDRTRSVDPGEAVTRLSGVLARARGLAGDAREQELLGALLEAGELAQGVADHAFEERGHDDGDDDPLLALTNGIARAWRDARAGVEAAPWPEPRRVIPGPLPARVRVKVPEGHAHYALYPELHARAAELLRAEARRWFVVGIRSVGTTLAAVVAATCGATDVVTVRPVGHPYHRELRIGAALDRRVRDAASGGAWFAVVDEGPGRSGSSFEAAARWLALTGVAPERIRFLPSHPGPLGPAAPPARRAWWDGVARRTATFEETVLPRLTAAVEKALGTGGLEDVGAGRWRGSLRPGGEPPPVFAALERRKYLARRGDRTFLLRFAGIGRYGSEALERACSLAEAGWGPVPHQVFPGFLATEVSGSAGPCACPSPDELAAYLEFRARSFPARDEEGASPEELLEMVRVNATSALGPEVEAAVARLAPAARGAASLPRVAVDGKLERWEWTRSPAGTPWKHDATDHAFGHDLVGCQPVTWDIAGARVELGLPRDCAVALVEHLAPGATPAVLAFHEAAWIAHRLGRWTFAREQELDPAEQARIDRILVRYRAGLRRRLTRA